MTIIISRSEFTFTFSRSGGAGGQNVNKVNTKATLTWDMLHSTSLSMAVKERFTAKYQRYIVDQQVVITSQRFRSQLQNIDDCVAKLHELIATVEVAPKNRRATRPTKSSVHKRLESKKVHSFAKKLRSKKLDW